tara:strand:+ start:557 stop:802 length:246 start_codon:yes stop_codon:yes gene_type:complete
LAQNKIVDLKEGKPLFDFFVQNEKSRAGARGKHVFKKVHFCVFCVFSTSKNEIFKKGLFSLVHTESPRDLRGAKKHQFLKK